MYTSEYQPGEIFKPKDNNYDINQLKQEISVLSDNFCRFKLLLKSYDKYFDYFYEILNTIEYYNKDLDLVNKFKSLSDIKTNIKALKECEKSCFVCLEKLNENQFNRNESNNETIDGIIDEFIQQNYTETQETIESTERVEKHNISVDTHIEHNSLNEVKEEELQNEERNRRKTKNKTQETHESNINESIVETSDEINNHNLKPGFECLLNGCQQSFTDKRGLNLHILIKHKNEAKKSNEKVIQKKKKLTKKDTKSLRSFKRQKVLTINTKLRNKDIDCTDGSDSDFELNVEQKDDFSYSESELSGDTSLEESSTQNTFRCNVKGCDYRGNKYALLFGHKKRMHSDKEEVFFCPHIGCGKQFFRSFNLYRHQKVHNIDPNIQYKCEWKDCTHVFKRRERLTVHMQTHRQKRTFVCTHEGCDYKTKTASKLKDHQLIHSEDRPLICLIDGCNKRFKRTSQLKYHQLRAHPQEFDDIPWFKCSQTDCNYQTKSRKAILNHERLHTRPFVCTECKKRFSNAGLLKAHMTSHSSELSYRCDWPGCDRLFSRKYLIEDHMNSHTLETTYWCHWPNCDKSYISKNSLNSHVHQTHRGRRRSTPIYKQIENTE